MTTYVTGPIGQIFLRLLFMLVIPLLFSALVVGIAEMGEIAALKRVGLRTLFLTICVSTIAVIVSLLLVNLLQPGAGVDRAEAQALLAASGDSAGAILERTATTPSGVEAILNIVPSNIVAAMTANDILAIMFFALFFGIGLLFIFANLLLGLYRPDSGRILFDGRDAGAFSLRSLRQQIGYVSQEAELFHASIRENILMGRPEADAATFEAAVRAAHVDDFVRTLPEGYDTIVGDRGVKLSGGQRQRIAIARALLRRPALFIFDEATSALDRDSEAFIQQTINEIARDATVLIISHRPAAVRDADRIYRLDGRGGVAIVDRAEQTDLAN